ncbi:MAG: hypothetical protein Q7J73_01270 [Dehalococcoidales bacterium]|nr:hypothetical protein [Dehalococcoidales bacterium]
MNKAAKTILALLVAISLFQTNTKDISAFTRAPPDSYNPQVARDNNGGSYIAFTEQTLKNILIQHIDDLGKPEWTVTVGTCLDNYHFKIFSDTDGNAFVIWHGNSNDISGVYAQKFDSQGRNLWKDTGVLIQNQDFNSFDWLEDVTATTDGNGGAIVVSETRSGTGSIYVQRIDREGEIVWDSQNNRITNNANQGVECITDGDGGAIISWQDLNIPRASFAVRINSNGKASWDNGQVNGQVNIGYDEYHTTLLSDGRHGAIIFFYDFPNHSMLHIDETGNTTWKIENLSQLLGTNGSSNFYMTPDGVGGVIMSYHDAKNYMSANIFADLYASKLDAAGELDWTIPLGTAYYLSRPQAIPSGNDSFTVAWENVISGKRHIYLQKINLLGDAFWREGGLDIGRIYDPERRFQIVPNAHSGIILIGEEGDIDTPLLYSLSIDKTGVVTQYKDALYPSGAKRTYKDYEYPNIFGFIAIVVLGVFITVLAVIVYVIDRIIKFLKK